MTKSEAALAAFRNGFNCAQAVLGAFSGGSGLDENTALRISAGFGAGLGRRRELCGAVSAAIMVLGLRCGNGAKESNGAVYQKVQEFTGLFIQEKGTLVCSELLERCKLQTGTVRDEAGGLRERCCSGLVALACRLIEKISGKEAGTEGTLGE
jgi:C_GCAxxG_C_C family probable redox protein